MTGCPSSLGHPVGILQLHAMLGDLLITTAGAGLGSRRDPAGAPGPARQLAWIHTSTRSPGLLAVADVAMVRRRAIVPEIQ